MKRTLVLLSPIPVGVLAALVTGLAYPRTGLWRDQFLWWTLLYTILFLLVTYASILVYNGIRVVLRRGTTVNRWVLLRPLIVAIAITLLTGLFRGLVFDREATNYFTSYGLPFSWRSEPTATCQQYAEQHDPRVVCQAGFSTLFFLYDALIFLGLYLLLSYASTLVYNAVPMFKNKKWPFFLPKFSVRARDPRISKNLHIPTSTVGSGQVCLVRVLLGCGGSVPAARGRYSPWTISAPSAANAKTAAKEYTQDTSR